MNTPSPTGPAQLKPQLSWFEGWYDSSLDLKRGLVVTEHGAFDVLEDPPRPSASSPVESLTQWIRGCP